MAYCEGGCSLIVRCVGDLVAWDVYADSRQIMVHQSHHQYTLPHAYYLFKTPG
jgi:hypothetical protein